MKLADWLSREKITRTDFAARIGVSQSLVTALCKGDVWPGHDTAQAIRRETDGAVAADDFIREPQDSATPVAVDAA